eukprot:2371827-Rhodomonas_salina.1
MPISSYTLAMQRPGLTSADTPTVLRACYAVSGTDVGCAGTRHRESGRQNRSRVQTARGTG